MIFLQSCTRLSNAPTFKNTTNQRSVLGGTEPSPDSPIAKRVVMLKRGGAMICTASIVDDSHVITAAHCLKNPVSEYSIGFGPKGNTHTRAASAIGIHESYPPDGNGGSYDVGLVTFSGGIPSGFEKSTFLDPSSPNAYTGVPITHAGYGYSTPFGNYGTLLQATDYPEITYYSPTIIELTETVHSSCSGDSGSPYLVQHENEFIQIAVHSASNCNGNPDGPYLNVGNDTRPFIAWMKSKGANPQLKVAFSKLSVSLLSSQGDFYSKTLPPTAIGYACPGVILKADLQGEGIDSLIQVCKGLNGMISITPYHWNNITFIKAATTYTSKPFGGGIPYFRF